MFKKFFVLSEAAFAFLLLAVVAAAIGDSSNVNQGFGDRYDEAALGGATVAFMVWGVIIGALSIAQNGNLGRLLVSNGQLYAYGVMAVAAGVAVESVSAWTHGAYVASALLILCASAVSYAAAIGTRALFDGRERELPRELGAFHASALLPIFITAGGFGGRGAHPSADAIAAGVIALMISFLLAIVLCFWALSIDYRRRYRELEAKYA